MFRDRIDAGRRLAEHLEHFEGQDAVVLGLPRGGVPVALQVAQALAAPLDVIVVRKLGVPYQPELAMGAIGESGVRIINHDVVSLAGITSKQLADVEKREREELDRRVERFRRGRPRVPLAGRIAVIVDDGIATGSTARAAAQVARALGAARVVVATPVGPRDVEGRLAVDVDELIVVETPEPFFSIGQFYLDFTQTTDEDVIECLQRALEPHIHEVGSLSRRSSGRDPVLEHAEEEAEGTEILEPIRQGAFLEQEREQAQGVEVFEDPDATLSASVLQGRVSGS